MCFSPRLLIVLFCILLTSCVHHRVAFTHSESAELRRDGWPELRSRYLVRFSGGTIAAGRGFLPYIPFALSLTSDSDIAVRVELEDGSKRIVVLGHDGESLSVVSNGVSVSIPAAIFDEDGVAEFTELVGNGVALFKGVTIYVKADVNGVT
ncbi:hypothetical protein [Pseudoalteromonas marina]|uniref:Lipoprotein n=1 Tax=Pseudoalteromonas marina TaxID=267375 RepID=A0ABT9FBV8_9GAMM|nr:hypothetical protein [Pseudoalteromonas marina]MDP2564274.1 hypothetical protein [Pseudoalteromonas marina]